MPWSVADVPRFNKSAKSASAKKEWVAVANEVLAKTQDDGRAVREANSVIRRRRKMAEATKGTALD